MRSTWMMCGMMVLGTATASAQAPAPAKTASVEATKESQRAVLRNLQVLPRSTETDRLNLEEAILDWTQDGHISAARIASGRTEMNGTEPGVMNLSTLKSLTALQKLELSAIAVTDLKAVAGLTRLRELRVVQCAKLKNVADELVAIQTVTGKDVPLFGCYCAGEFGPADAEEITDKSVPYGRGWHIMVSALGKK